MKDSLAVGGIILGIVMLVLWMGICIAHIINLGRKK